MKRNKIMNMLQKFALFYFGDKKPKITIDTAKEDIIKKVNAILLEPESIDTMIPACKNCEHCIIYDQSIHKNLGKAPECNRPTGFRAEHMDFINGISSSKIQRDKNSCYIERDIGRYTRNGTYIICGKEAIFFKEKK